MTREDYLPALLELFRQYGYDGVSLSKIAVATGLGKASLYHHFPGGKSEMLAAVLDWTEQWMEENLLSVLQPEIGAQMAKTQGTAMRSAIMPKQQFQQMCDRLNQLYDSGNLPCLLATLTTSATHNTFRTQVKARLQRLIEAIATLLTASGLTADVAQVRGEEAVISIQGSLILSRALEDPTPFQRVIANLPEQLCQGIDS
ncbi:MAG: TetR/AcrR family transcriptional regulator [Cyanobacteria bacterium P01_D01_bin.1]